MMGKYIQYKWVKPNSEPVKIIYKPAHQILVLIPLSSNRESGGPTQMRRLARVLAAGMQKVWS